MRTNPSFSIQSFNPLLLRAERTPMKQTRFRPSISTSKTHVESNTPESSNISTVDLTRQCPLHKKNHSLLKCRGFRMKFLAERKRFLKGELYLLQMCLKECWYFSICYKCCVSKFWHLSPTKARED